MLQRWRKSTADRVPQLVVTTTLRRAEFGEIVMLTFFDRFRKRGAGYQAARRGIGFQNEDAPAATSAASHSDQSSNPARAALASTPPHCVVHQRTSLTGSKDE
jgi:hypothetical protein